jgi:hypothetical protein
MGAATWITSGHWRLEADGPLFDDDDTEPSVSNFSAVIYMASITNGSDIHQHEITDFTQTSILHSSGNSTTINGTMTVSMSDGPHQNTSGYVNLQNNKVSIWLEPEGLGEEHFGPTPIYGMILPDSYKMSDNDWRDDSDDDSDDRSGSSMQGNTNDDSDTDDDSGDDSDDDSDDN